MTRASPGHGFVALPRVLVVTGTDTGVGKTLVTAALATVLTGCLERSVAVHKAVQTGITGDEEADIDTVRRLSGLDAVSEGVRLRAPMAPVAAARCQGAALPTRSDHLDRIASLAGRHDHVLVEGSGGVLVELTDNGTTLAGLCAGLGAGPGASRGAGQQAPAGARQVGAIIVCRSGLGTLNHTALTVEALQRRGVPITGLIIGSWPAPPDDVDLSNREHLALSGVPLLGVIPAGAGQLPGRHFRAAASRWFGGQHSGGSAGSTPAGPRSRPGPGLGDPGPE